MGAEALLLELAVVFRVNVKRGQHDIHVVGGQGGSAFGPIVDDLERDLQALLREDGIRRRFQAAVGDQTAYAAYPYVHANANHGIVVAAGAGRGRSGNIQRFGGIHFAAGRALATQLAEVEVAVLVQAEADHSKTNNKDKNKATFFNFYGHSFLRYFLRPVRTRFLTAEAQRNTEVNLATRCT